MTQQLNDNPDTGVDQDTESIQADNLTENPNSESDGVNIQNPEGLVRAFEKTKASLKEAKRKNEELQKQYTELQSKIEGIDPDEYQRLRTMQEDAEREKLRREKKYEELIESFKKQLQAKEEALNQLTSKYAETQIHKKLQDAFFKAGGKDTASFEALAPHLRKLATFDMETNEFSMSFRDLSKLNADGKPASPEEIIAKDFREDEVFSSFFAPENTHSGAGVKGGKVPTQSMRDKLSAIKDPSERRRLARQYGLG